MKWTVFLLCMFSISRMHAQNIMISDQDSPNETSIMFWHKDPAHMVAAANIYSYYLSSDSGKTWSIYQQSSPYGVWGDPVLDVDSSGIFYYFHLSNPTDGNWIDRIVCQKSSNKGVTWNEGTYTGLNGTKAQDKHWSAICPQTGNIYLTWTQFDKYDSKEPGDSSVILFSMSKDGTETWSDPVRLSEKAGDCLDGDNTTEGAVPAVGPNGEVYVAWAGRGGLVFDRSLDQGQTWLENDIFIDSMPTGWDYNVPGLGRCNGLPVTDCDLSGGAYHGTIYVNWSDQRNGENDTDIWLSKSVDGGNTWSTPVRVNNDTTKRHQFMTWMCVDQVTGYLYFIFYDRREHMNNMTDVYLARSIDGGQTFVNVRINNKSFEPKSWSFFGDYTNIYAYNGVIRPIWTRSDRGKLSIWTDLTTPKVFESKHSKH